MLLAMDGFKLHRLRFHHLRIYRTNKVLSGFGPPEKI